MNSIDAKRKELEKDYLDNTKSDFKNGKLSGFNLGVSLAQKEFLVRMEKLLEFRYPRINPIREFVKELKQSLGEKT